MRKRWLWSLLAIAPYAVTMIVLQSCGGEGGPLGNTGTSITKAFMALMSPAQQKASYIGTQKCADPACHGATDHTANYTSWMQTKHGQNDVGCERCHGPGSLHAANPTTANILTYPNVASGVVCAQCHGPTYDEWNASAHAQLAGGVTGPASRVGASDASGSRCGACHNTLVRAEYLEKGQTYDGLTTAQYQAMKDAVTGANAVVPHTATCVSCHNPHSVTGNLDADGAEVQLWHTVTNTDPTALTPPNNATVTTHTQYNQACGECHNGRKATGRDADIATMTSANMHDGPQMNMLLGVPQFGSEANYDGTLEVPIARTTSHAEIPGQCSHCHMGGGRHSFTVSYDTGCQPCHTAADAAARVDALKTEIVNGLYALRTKMTTYAPVVSGVSQWTTLSNSDWGNGKPTPLAYRRVYQNYYCMVRDNSNGVHNSAYYRFLLMMANRNIDALIATLPGPLPGSAIQSQGGLTLGQKAAVIQGDLARIRREEFDRN